MAGLKLKVEKRRNRSRSEIGHKGIEAETAAAGDVFFLIGKLRVNEEEDQDERERR